MALTPGQITYIHRNHRRMTVEEMEQNLKVTGILEYMKENGLETYGDIRRSKKKVKPTTNECKEGMFNVDTHKNWLIDDGTYYGKSY